MKFEDGKQYRVAFRSKPEVAFTITFDRSRFAKNKFGMTYGWQKATNGKSYYCYLIEDEVEAMRICQNDGRCHTRYNAISADGKTGWKEEALNK